MKAKCMKASSMWKLVHFLIFMGNICFSAENCYMRLIGCVEDYNNATIHVPEKVTSLSLHFAPCLQKTINERNSPSIMFVIDNSGSMSGLTSTTATDTSGARFKVTRALIDTIKNRFPFAKVGMVIFQNLLYIDTQNHPYAIPLPDNYPFPAGVKTQGYIPLMPLDSMLNGTLSVSDMLKDLLNTMEVPLPGAPGKMTTDLVYKPLFTEANGYTNINTAVDAAKFAMLKSGNPKENQFIIFLSDGEPMPQSVAIGTHGDRDPNDFQKAIDIPATFTIYFTTRPVDLIPSSLQTFTNNVRVNNYSQSNPFSNIWGIKASYDTLLSYLISQVITPVITTVKKHPELILNNSIYVQYNAADSFISIPNLSLKDSLTSLDMVIKYANDLLTTAEDTLMHVKFDVIRTDTRPVSERVSLVCEDPHSDVVALKTSAQIPFTVNIIGSFIKITMQNAGVVNVDLFNLSGIKVGTIFNGTMQYGISMVPLQLPQRSVNSAYVIVAKAGSAVTVLKTIKTLSY